jgi:cellulose synthase/poly-beta-1,6-N-acetylglucosamine synthase-like glycosyltransferase
LYLHDDSTSENARLRVDQTMSDLKIRYGIAIKTVRRRSLGGGKPRAVNNILSTLPKSIDYVLLCDSDSFVYDLNVFRAASLLRNDRSVAIIQFRNHGHVSHGGFAYSVLSESIGFYDCFVDFLSRAGWAPFLGHNAILRTEAIREIGGFTPGQLADDIEISVRLKLSGYRTLYVREVICGERHPRNYQSLRLRTRKWAYGCMQVLVAWIWSVIKSKRITPEKLTFFLTIGYYHFQILMLLYLILIYIILPFDTQNTENVTDIIIASGIILALTLVPSTLRSGFRHACPVNTQEPQI